MITKHDNGNFKRQWLNCFVFCPYVQCFLLPKYFQFENRKWNLQRKLKIYKENWPGNISRNRRYLIKITKNNCQNHKKGLIQLSRKFIHFQLFNLLEPSLLEFGLTSKQTRLHFIDGDLITPIIASGIQINRYFFHDIYFYTLYNRIRVSFLETVTPLLSNIRKCLVLVSFLISAKNENWSVKVIY